MPGPGYTSPKSKRGKALGLKKPKFQYRSNTQTQTSSPAQRAIKKGVKRAARKPKLKRKPVGVLAPGARFDRRTGKITPPKPVKPKASKVFGAKLPTKGPERFRKLDVPNPGRVVNGRVQRTRKYAPGSVQYRQAKRFARSPMGELSRQLKKEERRQTRLANKPVKLELDRQTGKVTRLVGKKAIARNEARKTKKFLKKRRRTSPVGTARKLLLRSPELAATLAKAPLSRGGAQRALGQVMGAIASGPTAVRVGKGRRLATAPSSGVQLSPKQAQRLGKIGANVGKDAIDLPAQTVLGAYYTAKPAAEALDALRKGDTRKAGRKAGESAKTLYEPYVQLAKNPSKSFEEHPLVTYLMVAGLKGGVGRGAGKLLRVAPSKRLRKAGSITGREGAKVEGTNIVIPRYYSKDVFNKAVQVAVDRRQRKRGKEPKATARQIQRRADSTMARNEGVRKVNRTAAIKANKKAVGKKPTAATRLAAERIITGDTPEAMLADLRQYRREIAMAPDPGTKAKKVQRETLLGQIDDAIAKFDGDNVRQAAENYVKLSKGLQDRLVDLKVIEPERAARARVMPFAVRKMGARYDFDSGALLRQGEQRRSPKVINREIKQANRDLRRAQDAMRRAEFSAAKSSPPLTPALQAARRDVQGAGGASAKRQAQRRVVREQEAARKLVDTEPPRQRKRKVTDDFGNEIRRTPRKGWVEPMVVDDYGTVVRGPSKRRSAADKLVDAVARERAVRKRKERLVAERDALSNSVLTTDEIKAQMLRETGTDDAAFLTQAPSSRGARNYFVAQTQAPTIGGRRRTGEAVRQGIFDADPVTLEESAVRAQGLIDAAEGWKRMVDEASYRKGGRIASFKNYADAMEAARGLQVDGVGTFRPVKLTPFQAKKEQLDFYLGQTEEGAEINLIESLQQATAKSPEDKTGPWVLMPDSYAARVNDHMKHIGRGNAIDPAGQAFGNLFRPVVLATSPKCLVGNLVEAGLRSTVAHAGPRSYLTMRRILKRLEATNPEYAKLITEEMLGGGHYAMSSRVAVKVTGERFPAESRSQKAVVAFEALGKAPGVRLIPQAWHHYTNFVMNTVNRSIERQFQTAMAGKRVRETLMTDRLNKLSNDAIQQAADGLLDMNTVVALGKEVDRMYGRYSKFSPSERYWISTYTPFVRWAFNAVRFVYDVLPRDHPVLTAMLASAYVSSEDWRKSQKLSFFVDDALPGFLQGSIPGKEGSHLRIARYTPFGAFADGGSVLSTFGNQFIPQFMGIIDATQGREWTGAKLDDDSPKGRLEAAVLQLFGATIPFFSLVESVKKSKEPTLPKKLRARLDPFKFTPSGSQEAPPKLDRNGLPVLAPPPSDGKVTELPLLLPPPK